MLGHRIYYSAWNLLTTIVTHCYFYMKLDSSKTSDQKANRIWNICSHFKGLGLRQNLRNRLETV